MKQLLLTVFMALWFAPTGMAQFDTEERCTICQDSCDRTDPHCGQFGVQWCGLWDQTRAEWMRGTLQAFRCVNCARTDPNCHPAAARPATAPDHFEPYCTECQTNCPATDPFCGNPGTQWCGVADWENEQWVEGTPARRFCRGRSGL